MRTVFYIETTSMVCLYMTTLMLAAGIVLRLLDDQIYRAFVSIMFGVLYPISGTMCFNILKAIRNAIFIFVGFFSFIVKVYIFASFQASCLSHETILSEVGCRYSLLLKLLLKNDKKKKKIKFLFDAFKNFKSHQIVMR